MTVVKASERKDRQALTDAHSEEGKLDRVYCVMLQSPLCVFLGRMQTKGEGKCELRNAHATQNRETNRERLDCKDAEVMNYKSESKPLCLVPGKSEVEKCTKK